MSGWQQGRDTLQFGDDNCVRAAAAGRVPQNGPRVGTGIPLFRLIDVGFSGTEGMVLADHPRRSVWEAENDGVLQVYLLDLKRPRAARRRGRKAIIEEYRRRYQPPAGFISLAE
jgi:hypothetical protein